MNFVVVTTLCVSLRFPDDESHDGDDDVVVDDDDDALTSRDYRRLLVQLEETERRFDDFWGSHLVRLRQCLELRLFEQDFRELQVSRCLSQCIY